MTDAEHETKKHDGLRKKRFSCIPFYTFRDITDVTTTFLKQSGIQFLMVDLDNTIAAYDEHVLSEEIANWLTKIKSSGVELFLISNSTRIKRVESFSMSTGIRYINKACKPSPKSLFRAMETAGFDPGVSALAGDQVFTDALAANRAGVLSIIVRPRRFTNPFLRLRYIFEVPFRAMCRNKVGNS